MKETTVAPASPEKSKSKIKKIFGKMKRSNSGYLYEDKNKSRNSANQQSQENSSSNTNNGSRCSEGSRFSSWMMANGNNSQFSEPEMPFGQWTLDTLGLFLAYLKNFWCAFRETALLFFSKIETLVFSRRQPKSITIYFIDTKELYFTLVSLIETKRNYNRAC